MVKRFQDEPSDKASERLRQFEEARGDTPSQPAKKSGASPVKKQKKPKDKKADKSNDKNK